MGVHLYRLSLSRNTGTVIERWVCKLCGHHITLHAGPALQPPVCPHGTTRHHAAPAQLMVRDEPKDAA